MLPKGEKILLKAKDSQNVADHSGGLLLLGLRRVGSIRGLGGFKTELIVM